MTDVETKVFPIEALREFCTRVFLRFGVPKNDAMQAAEVLASADLRGIDSHGVARLHSYFDMLSEGRINPKPEIKVVRSTLSTATVNGDNGLGLVVGPQANRTAMDMAVRFACGPTTKPRPLSPFTVAVLSVERTTLISGLGLIRPSLSMSK